MYLAVFDFLNVFFRLYGDLFCLFSLFLFFSFLIFYSFFFHGFLNFCFILFLFVCLDMFCFWTCNKGQLIEGQWRQTLQKAQEAEHGEVQRERDAEDHGYPEGTQEQHEGPPPKPDQWHVTKGQGSSWCLSVSFNIWISSLYIKKNYM